MAIRFPRGLVVGSPLALAAAVCLHALAPSAVRGELVPRCTLSEDLARIEHTLRTVEPWRYEGRRAVQAALEHHRTAHGWLVNLRASRVSPEHEVRCDPWLLDALRDLTLGSLAHSAWLSGNRVAPLFEHQGRPREARALLRAASERGTLREDGTRARNQTAVWCWAHMEFRAGRYEEALQLFEGWVYEPSCTLGSREVLADWRLWIARCQLGLARWDEARATLDAVVRERLPDAPTACMLELVIESFEREGRPEALATELARLEDLFWASRTGPAGREFEERVEMAREHLAFLRADSRARALASTSLAARSHTREAIEALFRHQDEVLPQLVDALLAAARADPDDRWIEHRFRGLVKTGHPLVGAGLERLARARGLASLEELDEYLVKLWTRNAAERRALLAGR